MAYNYSSNDYEKDHMARVVGRSLPISTKQSIEVCNSIRNKDLSKAKSFLSEVVEKRTAVPYKIFNKGVGHKRAIGPGRYPVKTSSEIIKLLESAEANAQFKGLDTSGLVIVHISAQKASKTWHYGRQRRRKMKRTNVELVVKEQKKEDKKQDKKKNKDQDKKKEVKKETKNEIKKEVKPSKPTKQETKK